MVGGEAMVKGNDPKRSRCSLTGSLDRSSGTHKSTRAPGAVPSAAGDLSDTSAELLRDFQARLRRFNISSSSDG